MKISLNWIKEFVDINDISDDEIIKRLNLSTCEIEGVEEFGADTSGIIVAKITSVKKVQSTKNLTLLNVYDGQNNYSVICGAPNVRVGLVTAYAPVGSVLNGIRIEEAKIAGHVSEGMCCSASELGISDDKEYIIEIDQGSEIGKDINQTIQIKDTILEIDNKSLTNRPDLWCHYGFAREISAIFEKDLKPININDLSEYKDNEKININIDDSNCYRYSAIKVDNVSRKNVTHNMMTRLYYTGMRTVNFLTDLSNYIMLEIGQPTHAFDSIKATNINVKSFNKDIDFETLDSNIKSIPAGTMFICDEDNPIAVAGIMGGLYSGIKDNTNSVVLESANFNSTSIRKSSDNIFLRTESSIRFEKSLSPELTEIAVARFVNLIKSLDGSARVISCFSDVYNYKYNDIKINITSDYVSNYIGEIVSAEKIANILKRLGFTVELNGQELTVKVPHYRATKDISMKVDIVEEVARIYGYDNISAKPYKSKITPVMQEREYHLEYDLKRHIAEKFGLTEIHTYLWNDKKANKTLNIETEGVLKVINSIVKENNELRSELMPSLISAAYQNSNNQSDMGIFEIGRTHSSLNNDGTAEEEKKLSIILSDITVNNEQLYRRLRDILDSVTVTLIGKKAKYIMDKKTRSHFHPVNSAHIYVGGKKIGEMGVIHPKVCSVFGKKTNIVGLELNFKLLSEIPKATKKILLPSKYQATKLDFNFILKDEMNSDDIISIFDKLNTKLEYTYQLKNVYNNSHTFTFTLSSHDHTLTGKEIENFYNEVVMSCRDGGITLKEK